jgi:hypothetical protein
MEVAFIRNTALRRPAIDLQVFNVSNGFSAAAVASGLSFGLRSHGVAMGYLPGAAAAARRSRCALRCNAAKRVGMLRGAMGGGKLMGTSEVFG